MKTVIEMAREVYGVHTEWTGAPLERLTHFAALVRADERETCAGLCDRFANRMMSAEECAEAIRARGSNT